MGIITPHADAFGFCSIYISLSPMQIFSERPRFDHVRPRVGSLDLITKRKGGHKQVRYMMKGPKII
jgi:hypothetical protein